MLTPTTSQPGPRPQPRQQLPRRDGHPDKGVGLGDLPHGNSCRLGPPLEGALCGGQPTGMVRRGTGCRDQPRLKGLPGGHTSRALPPLAERKSKIKTHREKTKTEVSSDTYPLRTRANRACGEAPQASVPAGAAEGCPGADSGAACASGGRGAEGVARPASSQRPEYQLPMQPAQAPALGGQADRPDSPESPRLPRPRGQVPPRPASAPRTGTLMSRP
jgi:hypothetical protein